MDHALLTRFNVAAPAEWGESRHLDGAWLRGRVELFESVCAPSVAAQSSDEFIWIVFVAPESPQWLRDRLRASAPRAAIHDARSTGDVDGYRSAVAEHLQGTRWMTTRVDSDDAIARDFVARSRAHAQPGFIAFRNGAMLDLVRRRASRYNYYGNPFLTRVADEDTAMGLPHGDVAPLSVLEGQSAAWLVGIHGGNVINRFVDSRPAPAQWVQEHFEIAPDLVGRWPPLAARRAIAVINAPRRKRR
jgi:hypothetical protein